MSDVEVEDDEYWLSKLLIEFSEDPLFQCCQCNNKFDSANKNPERRPVRSECSHSLCKICASKELLKYTTENNIEEIRDGDKSHSLICCKCDVPTRINIMLTRPLTREEIQYKQDMKMVKLMMQICEIQLPSRGIIGENEYFELLKKLAETGPTEFKKLLGHPLRWDRLQRRIPYLKNMQKAEGIWKILVQEIPIHFRSFVDIILNEETHIDSLQNVNYIESHLNFNEPLEDVIQRIDRKLLKELRQSDSCFHLLETTRDKNSCFRSKYCPHLLDVPSPLPIQHSDREMLIEEKVDVKTENL